MKRRLAVVLASVISLTTSAVANACRVPARFDPTYVRHAGIVVIGRVVDYRKLDAVANYARFEIIVDEVLVGVAPHRLSATWRNSTFERPEALPSEPMLIALRDTRATMKPHSEQRSEEVLQATCSTAFMLLNGSDGAKAVRRALDTKPSDDR